MKQITRTVLRNSAFGMVAQMLVKVLSFGFSVLIVRNLGASDFGQYSAVVAFGVTFSIFSDLGLSTYSVREIAYLRDQPGGTEKIRSLYANIINLRLILSGFTIVLMVIAAWLTNRPLLMIGAIALNSLGLLIYSFQGAGDAVLAGFERLDISSSGKVINQLIFVVLGGLVLLLGWGYYGLIGVTLIGVTVMAVYYWNATRKLGVLPTQPDPKMWGRLIKASLPFGLIGFAIGLSYKYDSILLNIYRGDTETGFYNAAYNLVFSAVLFSNVLNTALYPSLARQSVNDPDNLKFSYERALRYLMIFSLPVAVGGWVLADQIIPFLFTNNYLPAVPALRVIIWVVPLMFASEFFGYIVLISGHETRAARSILISTGFNVLINSFMVPLYGLQAAAIMTVLTEAVLVGQYLWIIRKLLAAFQVQRTLLLPALAALLMGVLTWILHGWMPVLVNIVISMVFYGVLLFLLRIFGKGSLLENIMEIKSLLINPKSQL